MYMHVIYNLIESTTVISKCSRSKTTAFGVDHQQIRIRALKSHFKCDTTVVD